MGIRWLFIISFGWKTVTNNSLYQNNKKIVKSLVDQGDFVNVVLPDFAEGKHDIDFPQTKIWFRKSFGGFKTDWLVTHDGWFAETFGRRTGHVPIDAIFSIDPVEVSALKYSLGDYSDEIPTMIHDPSGQEVLDTLKDLTSFRRKVESVGWSESFTWFLNERDRDIRRQMIAANLKGKSVDNFLRNSEVNGIPVTVLECEAIAKKVEKRKDFSLFFGGRFAAVKGIVNIANFFNKMQMLNLPCVMTCSAEGASGNLPPETMQLISKKTTPFEIHYGCNKQQFLNIASSCHAFMCWSKTEGFGVGFFELFACGLVGLIWEGSNVQQFLYDDYPYVFKEEKDCYKIVRYIKANPSHRQEVIARIKEEVMPKYDERNLKYQWREKVVSAVSNYPMSIGNGIKELISDCAQTFAENFTLEQLNYKMEELGKAWKPKQNDRMAVPMAWMLCTDYQMYHHLLSIGYVDDFSSEIPRMRKA